MSIIFDDDEGLYYNPDDMLGRPYASMNEQILIKAKFGSADVTDIVRRKILNGRLILKKPFPSARWWYTAIFGDPDFGKVKVLILTFRGTVSPVHIMENIELDFPVSAGISPLHHMTTQTFPELLHGQMLGGLPASFACMTDFLGLQDLLSLSMTSRGVHKLCRTYTVSEMLEDRGKGSLSLEHRCNLGKKVIANVATAYGNSKTRPSRVLVNEHGNKFFGRLYHPAEVKAVQNEIDKYLMLIE